MELLLCKPFFDFTSLYFASLTLNQNGNIFNPITVCQNAREYGFSVSEGLCIMHALPTNFWFIGLLSKLSYNFSLSIFLSLNILCLIRSVFLLSNYFRVSKVSVACFTLLFFPTIKSLYFGQISPIIFWSMLEVVLSKKQSIRTGLIFSLTILKINIFAPLYLCLLFYKPMRAIRLLNGFLLGLVLQLICSIQYFSYETLRHFSNIQFWQHSKVLNQPNLNSLLAWDFNVTGGAWYFLFLGLCINLYLSKPILTLQKFFPQVIPISLLTAPYLWSHDLIYLLPGFIYYLSRDYYMLFKINFILAVLGIISVLFFGIERYQILLPIILLLLLFPSTQHLDRRNKATMI